MKLHKYNESFVGRHYYADINRSRIGMTECSCNDAKQLNEKDFSLLTSHFSRKRAAFTLAEVLITLGIIGVVAALTIPAAVNSYHERQTIAKLKKTYSTFSNAYILTINEYGTPDTWDDINSSSDRTADFWNRVKTNLNVAKECGSDLTGPGNRFECWNRNRENMVYYSYLNGEVTINHLHNGKQRSAILHDGTMIALEAGTYYDTGCARNGDYFSCASLTVKTDNAKNLVYGKNIFDFRFEHNKFVPSGTKTEPKDCYNSNTGCTAWVVYNGNMDYLRCKDELSWNGKKKCN